MYYRNEFDVNTFEFWSGACDTIADIDRAGLRDQLGALIEEVFGDDEEPPTDTAINDFVWFERDFIYDRLGLDENGNEPEDEDEE